MKQRFKDRKRRVVRKRWQRAGNNTRTKARIRFLGTLIAN